MTPVSIVAWAGAVLLTVIILGLAAMIATAVTAELRKRLK